MGEYCAPTGPPTMATLSESRSNKPGSAWCACLSAFVAAAVAGLSALRPRLLFTVVWVVAAMSLLVPIVSPLIARTRQHDLHFFFKMRSGAISACSKTNATDCTKNREEAESAFRSDESRAAFLAADRIPVASRGNTDAHSRPSPLVCGPATRHVAARAVR